MHNEEFHFEAVSFITDSNDGKYRIQRSGLYSPYVLTVSDLQYADCGSYHCCLPSNRSDNNVSSSELLNNCQRFVLWVRGKNLTSKFMLVGL